MLFIQGLISILQEESTIEVVGVAHDGEELLQLLTVLKPEVVLLDINMPKLNGLEACHHVRQNYADVRVIILSTYQEQHLIEKAKQNGARGYLLKNCNKETLLETITPIQQGETVFSAGSSAMDHGQEADSFIKRFQLSRREVEVLRLVKAEFTNQQIADQLYLSVYIVETHRKNIKRKLGLTTQSSLIKFLLENDLG